MPAITKKETFISQRTQSLILIAAVVLFFVSLGLGLWQGYRYGQDQANLKNVSEISSALTFYHQDQDRYPTQDEFANQAILIPYYMSAMPVPANLSGECKTFTQYAYSQETPQDYSLQFCLNNAISGWSKGINVLKNE